MKHKIFTFLFALVLTLSLGIFERILACSISSDVPSFCEMVGSADVVFIGKAIGAKKQKIVIEDGVKEVWDVGEIYFEVQESFVGSKSLKKGIRLTLRSGDENGYCGTWFKHNESYLIYGFGNLKKGFVDGQRTNLAVEAQDNIKALKNLPKPGTGSTISGNITLNAKNSLLDNNIETMSNLSVKIQQIEGAKKLFEVFTDSNGDYEINNVPAGKYKVVPVFTETDTSQSNEVEVKDRGCVSKNFLFNNLTKISGRVLDADSIPVNDISVELVPVELNGKSNFLKLREYTQTDKKGDFTIKNVPPGIYTMSINYSKSPDEEDAFPTTFYPNTPDRTEAVNFTVAFGTKDIENIEFRLPPRLKSQEIKGIIVWSDGTPVNDAHVGLRDAADNFYTSDMRTLKNGEFILNGFSGRKYFISADNYSNDVDANEASYISTDKFVLDKDVKFFRLVLERKTK